MKNILIPIDFKYNSNYAIDYAVHLFKEQECNFYFFNTYSFNISGLNALDFLHADEEWFNKPKKASENGLDQLIYKYTFNNRKKKHRFFSISECESLVKGIKNAVKNLHINLVIMSGKPDKKNNFREYSANTRNIIEHIRTCPLVVVPENAELHKNYEFILASNFDFEIPINTIKNWCDLVKITNENFIIATLTNKNIMSDIQVSNQKKALIEIGKRTTIIPKKEYFNDAHYLKKIFSRRSKHIICLIDKKPNLLRKFGVLKSRITNLGPFVANPIVALHQ